MMVSLVVYFVCAMVVIQLWRQNRKRFNGIGFLALNYALQTAGLFALVTRGAIPEGVSIAFTNGLMVAGVIFGYYGFTLFCGKPQRIRMWVILFAAFMLAQFYWYAIEPNMMWRKVNSSAVLVVAGLLTAYFLLFMADKTTRYFTSLVGRIHLFYAAFFAVRAVIAFFEHRVNAGFFDPNTWESVLGLFYPPLFVLMTFSVGVMINRRLGWETEQAKAELKVLSGLLPICAHCKNVRDDRGYWNQIETYISLHSEADFSHGICPECEHKYYVNTADRPRIN